MNISIYIHDIYALYHAGVVRGGRHRFSGRLDGGCCSGLWMVKWVDIIKITVVLVMVIIITIIMIIVAEILFFGVYGSRR